MHEQILLQLIRQRIADAKKSQVDEKFVERQDTSEIDDDLSKIAVKMRVANEPGFDFDGHLNFVNNQIDHTTGTIPIRAIFDNPKKAGDMRMLVAGGHGTIRVPLSDEYEAILVPDEAIQFDQDREILYVVNDKDIVVSKQVTKGEMFDGLRIIRAGISPTDRIIVNGFMRVRPGVTVKPVTAEVPSAKKEAARPKGGETPKPAEAGK